MKLLPETPTPAMIDAAVAFALNVQVTGNNGWSHYMRDLYETMVNAAPEADPFCYASVNKEGDVTSVVKRADGWRKIPLYKEPT